MLVPSLVSLVVATTAAWVSANTKEDVIQAAMALTALLGGLLTLFFAPWLLKLLIVAIPLLLERMGVFSKSKTYQ